MVRTVFSILEQNHGGNERQTFPVLSRVTVSSSDLSLSQTELNVVKLHFQMKINQLKETNEAKSQVDQTHRFTMLAVTFKETYFFPFHQNRE